MLLPCLIVALHAFAARAAAAPSSATVTADTVESILQQDAQPLEGAFRVEVPQAELRVTLDGFALVPAMGLTTWVEMTPGKRGAEASARGEVVALEDEARALQGAARQAGFSLTGVERRFLREKPAVVFLEVSARGKLEDLQDRTRRLFAAITDERKGEGLQAGPTTAPGALDAAQLSKALGARPRIADGVAQARLPGAELRLEGTMEKAAAAVLLTLPEARLDPAQRALAAAGFETASLRPAGPGEKAGAFILRAWGVGPAMDLARAAASASAAR